MIQEGRVVQDGKEVKKAGSLLKPGAVAKITLSLDRPSEHEPYDFPLNIVYEDSGLLVVNKPAGLVVHPGAGNPNKTLYNALIAYSNSAWKPEMVHRLDKGTSGLLVIAKSEKVLLGLNQQFAAHTVGRRYYALAMVTPRARRIIQEEDSGRIETQLGRHPTQRTKMAVVETAGKFSATNWKVLDKHSHAYLLELRLETGRTHQIRVHLDHLASPILGDPLYGDFSLLPNELEISCKAMGRQALHAKSLSFIHPLSNENLSFNSELPDDFQELMKVFAEF